MPSTSSGSPRPSVVRRRPVASFSLDAEIIQAIREAAQALGISQSAVVERAVRAQHTRVAA